MLVAALLGVTVLLVLGLGRLSAAAVDRARTDAVADLTALAAVTGGQAGAERVASAAGGEVVRLTLGTTGAATVVVRLGASTASAAAVPGPVVVPG